MGLDPGTKGEIATKTLLGQAETGIRHEDNSIELIFT